MKRKYLQSCAIFWVLILFGFQRLDIIEIKCKKTYFVLTNYRKFKLSWQGNFIDFTTRMKNKSSKEWRKQNSQKLLLFDELKNERVVNFFILTKLKLRKNNKFNLNLYYLKRKVVKLSSIEFFFVYSKSSIGRCSAVFASSSFLIRRKFNLDLNIWLI